MFSLKEYIKFLANNATEEMKNLAMLLISVVCLFLISLVTFILITYCKFFVNILGYMFLGLLCIAILYIVVKSIYDFIKLTICYKNKR